MNYTINILCLLFLFGIKPILLAQNCNCSVIEVESNTVDPCDLVIGDVITVMSTIELKNAINQANDEGGNITILIADGTYQIASTSWYPYITANNIVFRSLSGNRDAVILTGNGMTDVAPAVENGIYCVGNNITIADLTIKDVGNHGIATQGDSLFVHNVKIQNTFEQMLKGTSSDNSIVQCSLFEYPSGVGPQFYIGGLDIHEGDNWIVRDNIFKNISSPSESLAEHAIHFWDFSSNNTIERNWIINCDRGIGFGLGSSPNEGGIIRNNMIYNDGSSMFNDVGIGLETSPNTKIYNNTIYINYQNAIEYRFTETTNVDITNNLTNKVIKSRNGGQASLTTNNLNAEESWFENLTSGNLRILSEIVTVTNQGTSLTENVTLDIDKTPRPQGNAYDIGASEYIIPLNVNDIGIISPKIKIFPNPSASSIIIKSDVNSIFNITIYNLLKQRIDSFVGQRLSSGFVINTNDWKAGIYFCHISDSKYYKETIRIVVSK
jgi:hypothetical protein